MKKIGELINQNPPEQRSWPKTEKEPSVSDEIYAGVKITNEVIVKITFLFTRLEGNYGFYWSNKFKDNDCMLQAAKREWCISVGQHSVDELNAAVERCKKEYPKNPPSVGEFMKLLVVHPFDALRREASKTKELTYQESERSKNKRFKFGKKALTKMRADLKKPTPEPVKKERYDDVLYREREEAALKELKEWIVIDE